MLKEDELSYLFPDLELSQDEEAEHPDLDQAEPPSATSSSGNHTDEEKESHRGGIYSNESEHPDAPVPPFVSPDSRHVLEGAPVNELEANRSRTCSPQLQDPLTGENLLTRTISNPIDPPTIGDLAFTDHGSGNKNPGTENAAMTDTPTDHDTLVAQALQTYYDNGGTDDLTSLDSLDQRYLEWLRNTISDPEAMTDFRRGGKFEERFFHRQYLDRHHNTDSEGYSRLAMRYGPLPTDQLPDKMVPETWPEIYRVCLSAPIDFSMPC